MWVQLTEFEPGMKKTLLLTAILIYGNTAMAQLSDGLYAVINTTMGGITCRLDYVKAPITCANFVGLAEGSQNWVDPESGNIRNAPFYDELIFHRVIEAFMIQGGCPLGTGSSGPGYAIPDEFDDTLTHYGPGILSMANSGPDSGGSQFFITLVETPWLDNKHSVFGEVVEGMDVLQAIGAVATDISDRPLIEVSITGITILRNGTAAENFSPSAQPLPEVIPQPLSVEAVMEVTMVAIPGLTTVKLFNSDNLTDWTVAAEQYFPEAATGWSNPIPQDAFYKAARVVYKDSVTTFSDIAGKTLTFTQGTSVLAFNPAAGGASGTCDIVGNPDNLTFWADWTDGAYPGVVVFQPEIYTPFRFVLSINGTCRGYQWSGGGWNDVGLFTLTVSP
jgi:cyclophilin family peptidyl-prolyl cis-trans isomerase